METFSFLNDIIQALLKFIPRPIIVRATHGGVKWKFGKWPRELKPGWHWIWPFTTEWEVIPTARQVHHLPTQALVTKDNQQIAVGTLVVYSIRDIMRAIGRYNWDTDSSVSDITLAIVVDEVAKLTFDELKHGISDRVAHDLTSAARRQLRKFGIFIHRVRLTEISTVTTIKLLGNEKMYSATNTQHTVT